MAKLLQIDAFADRPFSGNPAMVCLLEPGQTPTDEWMQAFASEVNLSETAYLQPLADSTQADYGLRWFTPAAEVDLCGHATLAAAHALFETGAAGDEVRFETLSGVLTVQKDSELLRMDFPRRDAVPLDDTELAGDLATALGVPSIGDLSRTPPGDLFATVESASVLRGLRPDFRLLKALPEHRAVMVTAAAEADSGVDFLSRFFAPNLSIDEDPVTGSAHCSLAPFWSQKTGKGELIGHQASARGGTVHCRVEADRVLVSGRAMVIYEGNYNGELDLPA